MTRWLAVLMAMALSAGAQNFTFWQMSDLHSPLAPSGVTIGAARDLAATGVGQTGAPAFLLVTGDLTEFGWGEGGATLEGWFADWPTPVYMVPGNHDTVWWPMRHTLQSWAQGLPWSFDHDGCHFVGLDSSGRQDPRPGFSVEELAWLAADLERVGPQTPVFIAFHHPLQGTEWASSYDYERLLAILRPYNVVLMMVGHGHNAVHLRTGDYDLVEGGSTFDNGADPRHHGHSGFNIIEVRDGQLKVSYKLNTDTAPSRVLLEKSLAPRPVVPALAFTSPSTADVARGPLAVQVALPAGATAATVRLGGGEPVALDADGRATLDTTEALPGRYILRAQAELGGRVLQGLQAVRLTAAGAAGVPREVWRRQVPASFRSTPVITPNRLYAADMAGTVYGLQADSGEVAWTYQAPAEVQGGLTLSGQTLLVPTIQGHLLALASTNGEPRWTYQASAAVVAPATVAGGRIYVPAVDGTIHCLRADGELLWQRKVADYSIETPVIVDGGRLYVGAWDQFVRCLAADTGELIWESKGEGSRNRPAPRYYSPGDAPPTVFDGRVLAADRNYDLIVLDAADGQRVAAVGGGVSTALSADGQGVWTKLIGGEGAALAKLDRDGGVILRVPAIVGSVPSIPAEADGLVAVTANASIVSAHAAADGALLWQYQVSPGLYLPAGAVTRAGVVYVVGMDGSITALTAQ